MKYYVYKTENLKDGKFYIGVHKSNDIKNDTYLGSGVKLKKAIFEFGIENFRREILFEFDTSQDAFKKEKDIVTKEFVLRGDTYNKTVGGCGRIYNL